MQIIIDVPDRIYKRQGYLNIIDSEILRNALKDGIPLPKGHGRLMILSEDKVKENQINLDFSFQKWIGEVDLSNATVTIIEADTESEE